MISKKPAIQDTTRAVPTPHVPVVVDHIAATLSIYHQHPGRDAIGTRRAFAAPVVSQEQPYSRELHLTQSPAPINLYWLTGQSGYLVFENVTGAGEQTKPTEDELKIRAKQVAYLSFDDKPQWEIPPGEFFVGKCSDAAALRVWAKAAGVAIRITAMPK